MPDAPLSDPAADGHLGRPEDAVRRRPDARTPGVVPPGNGLRMDYQPEPPVRDRVLLHLGLALATFASMVWAGATVAPLDLRYGMVPEASGTATMLLALLREPEFWRAGLSYAVPFFVFLTVHEFGHYIAARRHRLSVSLPYYLPVPFVSFIGTLGAVIRIRSPFRGTRQLFDVGAAGPIAGAVVAIGVTAWAMVTLPSADYLLGVTGHEDVVNVLTRTGAMPAFEASEMAPGTLALVFGDTPLFHLLGALGPYRVPGDELAHFPVLLAGWLGLFFTALNLLPIGQLDGGHVTYALFGPRVHGIVARIATLLLLVSGSIGFMIEVAPLIAGGPLGQATGWFALAGIVALSAAKMFEGEWRIVVPAVGAVLALVAVLTLGMPDLGARLGYTGWLIWMGLILFVIRVDHPPVLVTEPLTPRQRAMGYLCLVVFVLCFSIQPIQFLSA